jgi:hypothetical protein
MSTRIAMPHQQKIKPAFTVKKLDGTVETKVITYVDKKRTVETKKVPAGFMVRTLRGDEFRVGSEKELERLEMDENSTVALHDSENADLLDPVGAVRNTIGGKN